MPTTNRMPGQQGESSVRYLACKAEPGMFLSELLVCIEGFHPEHPEDAVEVQLLVNEREVKGLARQPKGNGPWKGWLQVSLAHVEGGMAGVILPEPAEPVGITLLVAAEHLGMPDPRRQDPPRPATRSAGNTAKDSVAAPTDMPSSTTGQLARN